MTTSLIIATIIILIAVVSFASYHKRQTAKMLVEDFLSTLSSSFHEIKWQLVDNAAKPKPSPELLAPQIMLKLRPLIENDLKQLLLCLHCFPSGKFKYLSGDEMTNKFVKITLSQVKKVQENSSYDQLPQKEVIESFFTTMQSNIQTLLSKYPGVWINYLSTPRVFNPGFFLYSPIIIIYYPIQIRFRIFLSYSKIFDLSK